MSFEASFLPKRVINLSTSPRPVPATLANNSSVMVVSVLDASSSIFVASRNDPSATSTIRSSTSSVTINFSPTTTLFRERTISAGLALGKATSMQRLLIVSGSLWASVVASKNMACFGGSSRVFRSALKASFVNMCTSSIIYIL